MPAPRGELIVLSLGVVFLAINGSALPVELPLGLGAFSRREYTAIMASLDDRAMDARRVAFEPQGFRLGELAAANALADSFLLPLLPLSDRIFSERQPGSHSQGANA